MKKLIFNILIFFVSSVILYLLVFIYFFFTFEKDFKITKENFNFQSLENLNFYKKYSKEVHHLRRPSDIDSLDKKDVLFNKLNNATSDKVILFQGDSWFNQINTSNKEVLSDIVKKTFYRTYI